MYNKIHSYVRYYIQSGSRNAYYFAEGLPNNDIWLIKNETIYKAEDPRNCLEAIADNYTYLVLDIHNRKKKQVPRMCIFETNRIFT